jgi:hypothetical protein
VRASRNTTGPTVTADANHDGWRREITAMRRTHSASRAHATATHQRDERFALRGLRCESCRHKSFSRNDPDSMPLPCRRRRSGAGRRASASRATARLPGSKDVARSTAPRDEPVDLVSCLGRLVLEMFSNTPIPSRLMRATIRRS